MRQRSERIGSTSGRIHVVLALLLSASASGCGWLFVSGPPLGYQEMDYFPCTETKGLAHLDVAMAALQVLNIITVLSLDDSGDYYIENKSTAIAVEVVSGGLWTASAISGYRKVDACVAAKLETARRGGSEAATGDGVAPDPAVGWRPPLLFPGPVDTAGGAPPSTGRSAAGAPRGGR